MTDPGNKSPDKTTKPVRKDALQEWLKKPLVRAVLGGFFILVGLYWPARNVVEGHNMGRIFASCIFGLPFWWVAGRIIVRPKGRVLWKPWKLK